MAKSVLNHPEFTLFLNTMLYYTPKKFWTQTFENIYENISNHEKSKSAFCYELDNVTDLHVKWMNGKMSDRSNI